MKKCRNLPQTQTGQSPKRLPVFYAFVQALGKDGIDIVLVVLISRAAGILDALGNFFDGLDNAVTIDGEGMAIHGILRIGASSSFSAGILPGILPGFHEKYPKVDVVIKTSDMLTSTFDLLRQNELDFIFTLERKLISADFVSVAERKEDIVFVTNPDNPLAAMKNVPLERVVRDNFITSDRGVSYGLYMEEALAERGISYHPSLEIGSPSAIINMICQGKGVSFLPKFLADDPINHGALAIIDTEKLEMQMWTQLIRLKNKWMNPVMKAFVDYLRENFHQLT